jgi:hypothetical protein
MRFVAFGWWTWQGEKLFEVDEALTVGCMFVVHCNPGHSIQKESDQGVSDQLDLVAGLIWARDTETLIC